MAGGDGRRGQTYIAKGERLNRRAGHIGQEVGAAAEECELAGRAHGIRDGREHGRDATALDGAADTHPVHGLREARRFGGEVERRDDGRRHDGVVAGKPAADAMRWRAGAGSGCCQQDGQRG